MDRDLEVVAFDFDERNPAMMEMLRLAVTGAKRNGRHVCGEAPANYPEIAAALVGWGIDSISVNPSSRIQLPEGTPEDSTEVETVCGLGNRKNDLVNHVLSDVGVEPYEGTVQFIHQLRHHGFKIAVVTSSEHCRALLKAAELDALFDARVDGDTIHAQHLAGKPAPDTFLLAAKLLGVEPARTVVIEDAISGVQAGANGNFGLVIGVARKGNAEELQQHGAHLVVDDLGELVD